MLILSDFLKDFRKGVKAATAKDLSLPALAKILGVDYFRLQKWEQNKSEPKDDKDRIAIKAFFGISDFSAIQENVLNDAIRRYPKGMAAVEDLAEPKKDQYKENSEKEVIEALINENNILNLSSHKTGETMDSRILGILERYSIAEVQRTEAELLRERSFDRITAILDRFAPEDTAMRVNAKEV